MVEQEISQDKEFSIDFKALWKVIKKEKLLIISSAFICAIIAAVIVFKKPNELLDWRAWQVLIYLIFLQVMLFALICTQV
jgi:hypothetical protein